MRRRDGLTLAHDDAGRGDPPMVLVHGWGVDRRVLRPLFDEVRRRLRVVSVDLCGFGESDAPGGPRTLQGHADDVAALIAALGLERPVIVGHSMGGVIALDLAARYGDRIAATVLLEALIVPPEEAIAGIRSVLAGLRSDRYREVVAGFMRHIAGPHLDPEDREQLVGTATSHPRGALADALEDMLAFDGAAAAARVRCPLFYVGTGTPYSDLQRLGAICPQLVTDEVVGAGHYFPLEVPEQLHPMVARFVEEHVPGGA
jgi:pimeloyl-ACP methyl ester carboxylesterase